MQTRNSDFAPIPTLWKLFLSTSAPCLKQHRRKSVNRSLANSGPDETMPYFGVNLDIVWDIVTVELPALESQVEAILQQEHSGG